MANANKKGTSWSTGLMTKVMFRGAGAEITLPAGRIRNTMSSSIPFPPPVGSTLFSRLVPCDLCIRAWDTHGSWGFWVNNLEVRFINGTSEQNRKKKKQKGSRRERSQMKFMLEFVCNNLYINLVSQPACFRYFNLPASFFFEV